MGQVLGSVETLKTTIIATGAITERRFITYADAQAGADAVVKGVSAMDAVAGDAIPATLIGIVDMISGGAIAKGDQVVSDANGQPVTKGAATNVAARALSATTGAGQRVSLFLFPKG